MKTIRFSFSPSQRNNLKIYSSESDINHDEIRSANTYGKNKVTGTHKIKAPLEQYSDTIREKYCHLTANRIVNGLKHWISIIINSNRLAHDVIKFVKESLAKLQEAEHQCNKYLFHFVLKGDLVGLQKRLINEKTRHRDKKLVSRTDALGGNVIHLAYLMEQYTIGKWLVENYPYLALIPYVDDCSQAERTLGLPIDPNIMPYTGQNIIHVAIVHQNLTEVRWLLDFYETRKHSVTGGLERLLLADATGTFFSRENEFYSGCFPLHFAVCSNDRAMFDLILAYSSCLDFSLLYKNKSDSEINARSKFNTATSAPTRVGSNVIFMRDSIGNNCLHLAVVHGLTDMYTHVLNIARALTRIEIKLACSVALLDESKPTYLSMESLPKWDKVITRDNLMESVQRMSIYASEDDLDNRRPSTPNRLAASYRLSGSTQPITNSIPNCTDSSIVNNGFTYGYAPTETKILVPTEFVRNSPHTFEIWLSDQVCRKVDERLEMVLNEEFHTPLTLGAVGLLGPGYHGTKDEEAKEKDILAFLLRKLKKFKWKFGPISSSLLPLEGVEYSYDADRYKGVRYFESSSQDSQNKPLPPYAIREMYGVLDWICITDSQESARIDELKAIVDKKWRVFGYPVLRFKMIFHAIQTVSITILLIFANYGPTTESNSMIESALNVLYPIAFIIMAIAGIFELPGLLRYGPLGYYGFTGWQFRGAARFEKMMRFLTIASFSIVCIFKYEWPNDTNTSSYDSSNLLGVNQVTNSTADGITYPPVDDPVVKIALTITFASSWLCIFYFLMVFDSSGPFVLTLYRIVSSDIPYICQFFCIVLIAFAGPISLLSASGNPDMLYGIQEFTDAITVLIQITANMGFPPIGQYAPVVDVNLVPSNLTWYYNFIITLFFIFVILIFMNLLIAMINNTFSELTECNDALLTMEKYNIMCAMERCFFFPTDHSHRHLYAVDINQELKTDDDMFDSSSKSGVSVRVGGESEKPVTEGFGYFNSSFDISATASTGEGQLLLDETDNDDNTATQTLKSEFFFECIEENRHWSTGATNDGCRGDDSGERNGNSSSSNNNNNSSRDQSKPASVTITNSQPSLASQNITLIIIDPQNDFHEGWGVPGDSDYRPNGSLAVKGSNEDSIRIRDFIKANMNKISDIVVTLDSHFATHIAHAIFWKRGRSNVVPTKSDPHPDEFTVITQHDIESEKWIPCAGGNDVLTWCKYYTRELEKKHRLKLTIWPQHCLVGTFGCCIVHPVNDAVQEWAKCKNRSVTYIHKGKNCRTEMYSALTAEVEDPLDSSTGMNWSLLAKLKTADRIFMCGQALSHCVKYTLLDLLTHWHGKTSRINLLLDCCSSVDGFEGDTKTFCSEMQEVGVTVLNSSDAIL